MSVQVENLEKNMAKLTIEVTAEDLEKALNAAYQRQKKNISIPGFRKGKVPRAMVEKMYGPAVFYEDAVNSLIPQEYAKAADESGLDIVSQPEIDVVQIEKGKPFIFTAEVAVKPEVTLGEYKGLEVPKADLEVTDEEIEAELKKEQEKNARTIHVEDRAAQEGDKVTIDFEGFVDGVAFEGGAGKDYPLTLGSKTFIPGFEEQLVGVALEQPVDVNVTFPEDYHAEDLKGQPVVFKVKVNAVQEKELPALDDEFAKDVSEFDTLADLKKDVKEKLQQEADKKAQVDMENSLITTVIENMEGDIPQCMYDNKINEMVNDFSYRLQSQGMSLDLYLHYTGSDMKSFRETFQESAERQVKIRLALEKIAEVENLTATPEEIDAEYEKIAKNYGIDVSRVKGVLPEKEVIKDVTVNKAIDLVKDSAEVTEKKVKKTASKSKKKAEEAPAENAEEASADEE